MPKKTKKRQYQSTTITNQKTSPGLQVYAGQITKKDDDLDYRTLYTDFTKMRNGDAVVSTSIDILKYPLENAKWRITAGAKSEKALNAEKYSLWALENLYDGTQDLIHHALLSLDYGFMMFEKVKKRGIVYFDGSQFRITNAITRISPIMPEKITRFYYNQLGDFTGIEMEKESGDGGCTLIQVDAADLCWITNNGEFRDIRGRSELRTARLIWQIKQQTLIGAGMLKARAAGMPELKIHGAVTSEKLASAQDLGRTIGNTDQWYAITNDELTLTLHSPHDQGDNVSFVDMLNRELFYNTLTEFLSSGIGGNGSRAATSEHKTAYELKANMVLRCIERFINGIITEMIDISYLPVMEEKEYPIFQFDAISQVDAGKVASTAMTMFQNKIIEKREGDEAFFRNIIGLPEPSEPVVEVPIIQELLQFNKEPEKVIEKCNNKTVKLTAEKRKLSQDELDNHIKKVFSLESATNHFLEMQEKAGKEIEIVMEKIFKDIAQQLEKNHKREIDVRFESELRTRLRKIFEVGVDRGRADVYKELEKIGGARKKLEIPKKTGSRIDKLTTRLLTRIKQVVEDKMGSVTMEWIGKEGGIYPVVLGIQERFKRQVSDLAAEAENGYTAGRMEALRDERDSIEDYIYTAILDKSLCDNCAPFDGMVLTDKEWREMGLNDDRPVNPDCLGQDRCRCQKVPYKLKEYKPKTEE